MSILSKNLLVLFTMTIFSGCALENFWSDGDSEVKPQEASKETGKEAGAAPVAKVTAHDRAMDDMELKQARLWARIDELEEQLQRQKERLKVLEKGLVLGLVPGELKIDGDKSSTVEKKSSEKDKAKGKSKKDIAMEAPVASDAAVSENNGKTDQSEHLEPLPNPTEDIDYQKRLAAAQEHYRAGRYGRAIAEYSAIGKDFPEKKDGVARFWVALSWGNLKENQTAKQHLEEFLKDYPTSPWVPRAKLELSRVNVKLGFRDKAVQELRSIIRDFPYEDAAEMAKMELNSLQKAL